MTIDSSNILTVLVSAGSTLLTLWAHGREFNKEKRRTLNEYATAQVKANGLERDIAHTQRDLKQLSSNVALLDQEHEVRVRALEAELSRMDGSLSVLQMLVQPGSKG